MRSSFHREGLVAISIKALAYLLPSLVVWLISGYKLIPAVAAVCVLLVLRGVFWVTEFLADEVAWRLGDGQRLYAFLKEEFHKTDYPNPSKLLHFGALDYLERMSRDGIEVTVKSAAKEIHHNITMSLHNLPQREKARYEAVLSDAFRDWFAERWPDGVRVQK